MRSLRLALALAALASAATPAAAGEVRGRVRYAGAPPTARALEVTKDRGACGESSPDEGLLVSGGGLANVVVRIAAPGAPPPPREAVLDQRGCRFVPHVQAVPVGSRLVLLNGDPVLHGVRGEEGPRTAFDVPLPADGRGVTRPLARPGPIRIGCDVHGWMSAWVVVVDGPYVAVTDASGAFAVAGVPAGRHAAIAWHERLGERVATVEVPAEGAAVLELVYP
jgi:hypothetical protein